LKSAHGQPPFSTGEEHDAETDLGYFGARYFSSAQGRFTSDDPLNIPALQRLNPDKCTSIIENPRNGYAYDLNNPREYRS
jgi:RHS repeat-associated protein